MNASRRGWGYAIDYAKAIREDEARIAHLTSPMCLCVSRDLLPAARAAYSDHAIRPAYGSWDVYHLITYTCEGLEGRASKLGLTLEDVRAWAFFVDEASEAVWAVLGDEQRGDYARGKAIETRFSLHAFEVYTEDDRRKALSKARAALARHKRNASKWS